MINVKYSQDCFTTQRHATVGIALAVLLFCIPEFLCTLPSGIQCLSLYFFRCDLRLMQGEIKITFAGERNFTFLEPWPAFRLNLEANLPLRGGFNIVFNALVFSVVSNWSPSSNSKSPEGKRSLVFRCRFDEFSTLDRLFWWEALSWNSLANDEMFLNFASLVTTAFLLSELIADNSFDTFGSKNDPLRPTPLEWTSKPESKAVRMADFTVASAGEGNFFSLFVSSLNFLSKYFTIFCLEAPWSFPLATIFTASSTCGTKFCFFRLLVVGDMFQRFEIHVKSQCEWRAGHMT